MFARPLSSQIILPLGNRRPRATMTARWGLLRAAPSAPPSDRTKINGVTDLGRANVQTRVELSRIRLAVPNQFVNCGRFDQLAFRDS